eukprot:GEMP01000319.1.p1 GENE.GEMP01000319.1~~GEMP01000319.1.p1  ORF type:complete len:2509 (+),score=596.30 GEMP01000319.1:50-7576(+)
MTSLARKARSEKDLQTYRRPATRILRNPSIDHEGDHIADVPLKKLRFYSIPELLEVCYDDISRLLEFTVKGSISKVEHNKMMTHVNKNIKQSLETTCKRMENFMKASVAKKPDDDIASIMAERDWWKKELDVVRIERQLCEAKYVAQTALYTEWRKRVYTEQQVHRLRYHRLWGKVMVSVPPRELDALKHDATFFDEITILDNDVQTALKNREMELAMVFDIERQSQMRGYLNLKVENRTLKEEIQLLEEHVHSSELKFRTLQHQATSQRKLDEVYDDDIEGIEWGMAQQDPSGDLNDPAKSGKAVSLKVQGMTGSASDRRTLSAKNSQKADESEMWTELQKQFRNDKTYMMRKFYGMHSLCERQADLLVKSIEQTSCDTAEEHKRRYVVVRLMKEMGSRIQQAQDVVQANIGAKYDSATKEDALADDEADFIDTLHNQLSIVTSERDVLTGRLEDLDEGHRRVRSNYANVMAELDMLKNAYALMEEENTKFRLERDEFFDDISSLQKKNVEQKLLIGELKATFARQESTWEILIANANSKLEEAERVIVEVNKDLKKEQLAYQTVVSQVEELSGMAMEADAMKVEFLKYVEFTKKWEDDIDVLRQVLKNVEVNLTQGDADLATHHLKEWRDSDTMVNVRCDEDGKDEDESEGEDKREDESENKGECVDENKGEDEGKVKAGGGEGGEDKGGEGGQEMEGSAAIAEPSSTFTGTDIEGNLSDITTIAKEGKTIALNVTQKGSKKKLRWGKATTKLIASLKGSGHQGESEGKVLSPARLREMMKQRMASSSSVLSSNDNFSPGHAGREKGVDSGTQTDIVAGRVVTAARSVENGGVVLLPRAHTWPILHADINIHNYANTAMRIGEPLICTTASLHDVFGGETMEQASTHALCSTTESAQDHIDIHQIGMMYALDCKNDELRHLKEIFITREIERLVTWEMMQTWLQKKCLRLFKSLMISEVDLEVPPWLLGPYSAATEEITEKFEHIAHGIKKTTVIPMMETTQRILHNRAQAVARVLLPIRSSLASLPKGTNNNESDTVLSTLLRQIVSRDVLAEKELALSGEMGALSHDDIEHLLHSSPAMLSSELPNNAQVLLLHGDDDVVVELSDDDSSVSSYGKSDEDTALDVDLLAVFIRERWTASDDRVQKRAMRRGEVLEVDPMIEHFRQKWLEEEISVANRKFANSVVDVKDFGTNKTVFIERLPIASCPSNALSTGVQKLEPLAPPLNFPKNDVPCEIELQGDCVFIDETEAEAYFSKSLLGRQFVAKSLDKSDLEFDSSWKSKEIKKIKMKKSQVGEDGRAGATSAEPSPPRSVGRISRKIMSKGAAQVKQGKTIGRSLSAGVWSKKSSSRKVIHHAPGLDSNALHTQRSMGLAVVGKCSGCLFCPHCSQRQTRSRRSRSCIRVDYASVPPVDVVFVGKDLADSNALYSTSPFSGDDQSMHVHLLDAATADALAPPRRLMHNLDAASIASLPCPPRRPRDLLANDDMKDETDTAKNVIKESKDACCQVAWNELRVVHKAQSVQTEAPAVDRNELTQRVILKKLRRGPPKLPQPDQLIVMGSSDAAVQGRAMEGQAVKHTLAAHDAGETKFSASDDFVGAPDEDGACKSVRAGGTSPRQASTATRSTARGGPLKQDQGPRRHARKEGNVPEQRESGTEMVGPAVDAHDDGVHGDDSDDVLRVLKQPLSDPITTQAFPGRTPSNMNRLVHRPGEQDPRFTTDKRATDVAFDESEVGDPYTYAHEGGDLPTYDDDIDEDLFVEVVDAGISTDDTWEHAPLTIVEWLKLNLMQRQQGVLYCANWQTTPLEFWPHKEERECTKLFKDFEVFLFDVMCLRRPSKHEQRKGLRKIYKNKPRDALDPDQPVVQLGDADDGWEISMGHARSTQRHGEGKAGNLHKGKITQLMGPVGLNTGVLQNNLTVTASADIGNFDVDISKILGFDLPESIFQDGEIRQDIYCLKFADAEGIETKSKPTGIDLKLQFAIESVQPSSGMRGAKFLTKKKQSDDQPGKLPPTFYALNDDGTIADETNVEFKSPVPHSPNAAWWKDTKLSSLAMTEFCDMSTVAAVNSVPEYPPSPMSFPPSISPNRARRLYASPASPASLQPPGYQNIDTDLLYATTPLDGSDAEAIEAGDSRRMASAQDHFPCGFDGVKRERLARMAALLEKSRHAHWMGTLDGQIATVEGIKCTVSKILHRYKDSPKQLNVIQLRLQEVSKYPEVRRQINLGDRRGVGEALERFVPAAEQDFFANILQLLYKTSKASKTLLKTGFQRWMTETKPPTPPPPRPLTQASQGQDEDAQKKAPPLESFNFTSGGDADRQRDWRKFTKVVAKPRKNWQSNNASNVRRQGKLLPPALETSMERTDKYVGAVAWSYSRGEESRHGDPDPTTPPDTSRSRRSTVPQRHLMSLSHQSEDSALGTPQPLIRRARGPYPGFALLSNTVSILEAKDTGRREQTESAQLRVPGNQRPMRHDVSPQPVQGGEETLSAPHPLQAEETQKTGRLSLPSVP